MYTTRSEVYFKLCISMGLSVVTNVCQKLIIGKTGEAGMWELCTFLQFFCKPKTSSPIESVS